MRISIERVRYQSNYDYYLLLITYYLLLITYYLLPITYYLLLLLQHVGNAHTPKRVLF